MLDKGGLGQGANPLVLNRTGNLVADLTITMLRCPLNVFLNINFLFQTIQKVGVPTVSATLRDRLRSTFKGIGTICLPT